MIRCVGACVMWCMIGLSVIPSSAKANEVDSLKNALEQTEDDWDRVNTLNLLTERYYRNNADTALFYAQKALVLSRQIEYPLGQAHALRRIGGIYSKRDDFDKAQKSLNEALTIYQSLNESVKTANVYNNLASVYRNMGQYPLAFNQYVKALKIANDEDNLRLKAMLHNNMGILFKTMGEYDSAVSHYFQALEIKILLKDSSSIGSTYTNIGLVKLNLGDYRAAESYLTKALNIDLEQKDNWGIANGYENMGMLHLQTGKLDQAELDFEKAINGFKQQKTLGDMATSLNQLGKILILKKEFDKAMLKLNEARILYDQLGHQQGQAQVLTDIAQCHLHTGESNQAIIDAKLALAIAQNIGALKEAVAAAETLYHIYGKKSKGNEIYEYAQLYLNLKDSLFNHQRLEYIDQLESKRQLSQVEQNNRLLTKENQLREKELEASNLKIQRQNAIQYALMACLIFAVIAATLGYLYYIKKVRTIKLLQNLNTEIHGQKEQISYQANELKRVNSEMKQMNESLEYLVEERTKKIEVQNRKLKEYAFSNSHEVRAPLANLLGLVNISKTKGITPKDQEEIVDKIHVSAQDLDEVITRMNKLLEEENLS